MPELRICHITKTPESTKPSGISVFCYAMKARIKNSTENAIVISPALAFVFTVASSVFLFSDIRDTPPTIIKAMPTIIKKRFTENDLPEFNIITVNIISPYSTKINTFLERFDTKSTRTPCANITKRCQLLKYAYFLAI